MAQDTEPVWDLIFNSIIYNGDAYLTLNDLTEAEKKEKNEHGKYLTKGNVTEQGILRFFMRVNEYLTKEEAGDEKVYHAKETF